MDIISYLLELIETQKTVGINGLGTLYKKKIPGRYDADTHSFLPPKHEIAFTTEISEQEELVKFISEKRNISIESANYYIAEFVENIHSQLADHQHASMLPIGELKFINDEIIFEASRSSQADFDFYGLPSIPTTVAAQAPISAPVTEPINIEEEKQPLDEGVPATDEQPVYEETAEVNTSDNFNEKISQTENEVPSSPPAIDPIWRPTVNERYQYEPDDDDDDENTGRRMRIFLKTLLVLFVLLIAGGAMYIFYPELFSKFQHNTTVPIIENASVVLIDTSSNQTADSASKDTAVKKPVVFTKPVKDSLKIDSNIYTYEVIGSAMKTQKKVDEVIAILSKRGINAKKMESTSGRLIKISLGTFTDYQLAKKFQDSLKIKLKNPEIYIQTIKPKN